MCPKSFSETVPTVGVIGTGRLGGTLVAALSQVGCRVRFLASKRGISANKLAETVGAEVIHYPYEEIIQTELIFITTPDSEIPTIVECLSKNYGDWSNKRVYHCSGFMTSRVLESLRLKGAATLTFHPLQTFPNKVQTSRFEGIYFALEGDDVEFGRLLAERLGGNAIIIDKSAKTIYHAAACCASNYLFALAYASIEMMNRGGINSKDALKMIIPLMEGSIKSIKEFGIEQGLTGPIARGDVNTVANHIEALKFEPELKKLYICMGYYLLQISGLNLDKYEELKEVLRNN